MTDAVEARGWRGLIGSIRLGQIVITVVLIVVGTVRAIGDGTPWPGVVAVAAVFAGWYFGGLRLVDRARDPALATWWLLGLALIWIGAVAVSPEFVWLAFPLWLLAGFVLRLRWAVPFSILVFVVVVAAPLIHTGTTTYANVIGPLIGGVFALGISRGYLELVRDGEERRRLIASLVATQAQMAELQDELARTQRDSGAGVERTRLSRDIHDTVAQSLSSIGLIAGGARARGEDADGDGDGDVTDRALDQIQALAREGLGDTRRIVDALTPAELEGSALGDALRRMLSRLADETGMRTDLHVDETVPALPVAVEVALLRTAQSALANVREHAGAERVVVSLVDAGSTVRLDVVDDGAGFDLERWDSASTRRPAGGYGLRAMRARLRELGGGLDIESTPGAGTALSASLPLGGTGGA
ncbi:sensor histidine kinase [Microbacterium sp. 2FI]|uniref:sensor histidine kinase n=1 Tax=Microbacterium sp. 2FI TaxID=2502193 RepID=UPI002018081A|nr:sensor histidine kinase [Microbacterium sp. 2FI]